MTEILKVPFNRSYWVVPGKLLAGCYPGSEDPIEEEKNIKGLIQSGIRHVISLMEPQEYNRPDDPFPPYVDHMESFAQKLKIIRAIQNYKNFLTIFIRSINNDNHAMPPKRIQQPR